MNFFKSLLIFLCAFKLINILATEVGNAKLTQIITIENRTNENLEFQLWYGTGAQFDEEYQVKSQTLGINVFSYHLRGVFKGKISSDEILGIWPSREVYLRDSNVTESRKLNKIKLNDAYEWSRNWFAEYEKQQKELKFYLFKEDAILYRGVEHSCGVRLLHESDKDFKEYIEKFKKEFWDKFVEVKFKYFKDYIPKIEITKIDILSDKLFKIHFDYNGAKFEMEESVFQKFVIDKVCDARFIKFNEPEESLCIIQ